MKKILFIFTILILTNNVYASDDINITKDALVKYKWYKEVKEELYYPSEEPLEGYIEDTDKREYYGNISWGKNYCKEDTPDEFKRTNRIYEKLKDINNIFLKGLNENTEIVILKNGEVIKYNKSINKDYIYLDLIYTYNLNDLTFYINTDKAYDIETYLASSYVATRHVQNERLIKLDTKNWQITNNSYSYIRLFNDTHNGLYVRLYSEEIECANQKYKTYRYKITREYYDDDYHDFVPGYIPDYSDVLITYKGTDLVKATSIKKIDNCSKDKIGGTLVIKEKEECTPVTEYIEKPVIKYEYIKDNNNNNNIKKVSKTKEYIIITILTLLLIILIIKIIRKNVD